MRRPRRLCLTLLAVLALGLGFVADSAFAQSKYKESPALAEAGQGRQAAAGRSSACPADPLVVPVVERIGTYGGVWRRAFLGPADANNYVRVVYDALVRFSPDGAKIEPKIAAGWESSKDFKQWTIKLRQGARWSDGAPFTADDIVFWYQDVLLNKDLCPAIPSLDAERRRHDGRGREGRARRPYASPTSSPTPCSSPRWPTRTAATGPTPSSCPRTT